MHLNIPTVEESEAGWLMLGGWLPYPSSLLLKCWLRKVKWMSIIALAPEIGVAMAARQFLKAREMNKKFQNQHFTLTHCFYALMGGFVIAVPGSRDDNQEGITNTTPDSRHLLSSEDDVDIYTLEDEDFGKCFTVIVTAKNASGEELITNNNILKFEDALKDMGLFPATRAGETQGRCLPITTEEDIRDRSKSDAFTKAFAFIQCAWLITQCITRAAVGLPLTELELMTIAFIIAALVMYGLWWRKPFDVQRATMLVCPDERASEIRSRLIRTRENPRTRKQWRQVNETLENVLGYSFFGPEDGDGFSASSFLFSSLGTVISGLHIAAWSWDFPSHTIRILWRVFSVAATCGFPSLYLWVIIGVSLAFIIQIADDNTYAGYFVVVAYFSLSGIYIISRLGLIFLVFYCFSSMPAAVYETVDWTTIFPHFS